MFWFPNQRRETTQIFKGFGNFELLLFAYQLCCRPKNYLIKDDFFYCGFSFLLKLLFGSEVSSGRARNLVCGSDTS